MRPHSRGCLRLQWQSIGCRRVCGGTCLLDADADGICDDVDDCIGEVDALGVCDGSCVADDDADGICDDVDDCVGVVDACGICNGPGAIYSCGCEEMTRAIATATETSSMHLANVAVPAMRTSIQTASATTWMIAQAPSMSVGCAMVLKAIYTCGCEDIPAGECDCEGTQLDASASAAVTAWRMSMLAAFVTTWTIALASLTFAASATAPAPSRVRLCGYH